MFENTPRYIDNQVRDILMNGLNKNDFDRVWSALGSEEDNTLPEQYHGTPHNLLIAIGHIQSMLIGDDYPHKSKLNSVLAGLRLLMEGCAVSPQFIKPINTMDLIEKLSRIVSGGHFTVMKFTTNWRVVIGPQEEVYDFEPMNRAEHFNNMPVGRTLNEAIENALERPYG